MGGYLSGRTGWRAKCEGCLSIDVRRWARGNYLSRPYFGWQWTVNGDRTSSIGVWGYADHIELAYAKDGENYRYPVRLASTRCHLGGARQWFICPARGCGRRVAILYLASHYFACRRCYNLSYQSQSYSPCDRALTQAGKIRRKLNGAEGIANPFPRKPKRMHWRTYDQLREQCERYEEIADSKLFRIIARLLR